MQRFFIIIISIWLPFILPQSTNFNLQHDLHLLGIVFAQHDTGSGPGNQGTGTGEGSWDSTTTNETIADTGQNVTAALDSAGDTTVPDPAYPIFPAPGTPPSAATPTSPSSPGSPTVPPPGTAPGTADLYPGVSSKCINNGTAAETDIDWVEPGTVTPARYDILRTYSQVDNSADGLQGYYFNNPNLTGTSGLDKSWTDSVINFSTQSPAYPNYFSNPDGSDHENFSVQWRGEIKAPESGTYTFNVTADDGIRLWVGHARDFNTPIIDSWVNTSPFTRSATLDLVAGENYSVTLNYFNGSGPGMIQFSWVRPSGINELVPTSQMYAGRQINPPQVIGSTTNTYYVDGANNSGGIPGPISNSNYSYRIVAVGSDGSKRTTPGFTVPMPNCTPPNISSIACGPGNQPSAQLNFNSNSININSFDIYRSDGNSTPLIASNIHNTSFVDNANTGMQNNVNYQYQVYSYTGDGNQSQAPSNWYGFNSNSCDTIPPTANFVTNIEAGGCYNAARWNDTTFQPLKVFASDNSGIQSVRIKLKATGGADIASVDTDNLGTFQDTTVTVDANNMTNSVIGTHANDGKWFQDTGADYLLSWNNSEDTGEAYARFDSLIIGQSYTVSINAGAGSGSGALIDIISPATTNTIYRAGGANFEETLSGLTFTASATSHTIRVRSRCCVGGDSDRIVRSVKLTGKFGQASDYWQAKASLPFQSTGGSYTLYIDVTPKSGPSNNPYDSKDIIMGVCQNPWIQTQGGDVHTNTQINVQ